MKTKTYALAEIFYSLQGEGARTGSPSVFVRFAGCNLDCKVATQGFDCDTDFSMKMRVTADQLIDLVKETSAGCRWLVLTGGEPTLQVDADLVIALKKQGYYLAIETNGTNKTPAGIDWVTISPKPSTKLKQTIATEVKHVIGLGGSIPQSKITALHRFISPAFDGNECPKETLDYCIKLCLDNPSFGLSVQNHKSWRVR